MGARSRPLWSRAAIWVYFIALILLLLLAVFLWKSGEFLVRTDPPQHTRWAAMLAGEGRDMDRSEGALELFREGRFDSLILSGPRIFKTHHESEFSSEFLVSRGFPKDRIFQLPHEATSTSDEATHLIQQARLLGIDTLLIITSNYHSARARRIFIRFANGNPVVRVAASESYFDPKAWWNFRETRVLWTVEWLKTFNTAWELRRHHSTVETGETILLEPNPRAILPSVLVLPPTDSMHVAAGIRDTLKADTTPKAPLVFHAIKKKKRRSTSRAE